jgi:hypothetical protein
MHSKERINKTNPQCPSKFNFNVQIALKHATTGNSEEGAEEGIRRPELLRNEHESIEKPALG